MKRMERVLSHFEQEAKAYDDIVIQLIPEYEKVISVLTDFANCNGKDHFSVTDLGCGTGTVSKHIEARFPNAKITCMDITEKMLQIAKSKMNSNIVIINDELQNKYLEHWKNFIVRNTSLEEAENTWLPNYYAEDRPTSLAKHFKLLENSIFSLVDRVYKYFNYAVYLAIKT